MEQLKEIRSWLAMQPGSPLKSMGADKNEGLVVLFDGGSQNEKLQAAELLAREAKKELYRVDLSKVVSKYIDETEKNLSVIFKKAESKKWILFFDEADALFGKRTEVRDSHDRYATRR